MDRMSQSGRVCVAWLSQRGQDIFHSKRHALGLGLADDGGRQRRRQWATLHRGSALASG